MQPLERPTVNCAACGKTFTVKPYTLNIPTKYGRFCSMTCRSRYVSARSPSSQKRRVKVNCAQCGKEIEIVPSRMADKVFCSPECVGKHTCDMRWAQGAELAEVECAYCGKSKTIPAWEFRERAKRGQMRFFCDRTCFGKWKSANWSLENNPSWKGGWTPHGKGWSIIAEQVRLEQGYECADCGVSQETTGKKLDVHHIVPARLFKRKADASTRPNLVALCHRCHMAREYGDNGV